MGKTEAEKESKASLRESRLHCVAAMLAALGSLVCAVVGLMAMTSGDNIAALLLLVASFCGIRAAYGLKRMANTYSFLSFLETKLEEIEDEDGSGRQA